MLQSIRALICIALTLGATAAVAEDRVGRPVESGVGAARSDVRAIGRVHPGNGAHCTGALVAPNAVVTAAHCLVNQRSKRWVRAESLHFLGGYKTGDYDFHARVERYTVSPYYDPKEPAKHLSTDWAILVLSEAAPAASTPLRVGVPAGEETVGEVTGYGIRRKYALSTSAPCRLRKVGKLLLGECESVPGMSGGPFVDVSTGEMIGMQVGGGHYKGRDVLVVVPSTSWVDALDAVR
jgi:protease YdgD